MENLKIMAVVFADYNGQDNLYFEVEESLKELFVHPVYENSKVLYHGTSDEGLLWVKVFSNGLAQFGFTMKADPLHGNSQYTWSSNASAINAEFKLTGTPYELARYGAGVKPYGKHSCYYAAELTKELALKIGRDNSEKLHYGLNEFIKTIDTNM